MTLLFEVESDEIAKLLHQNVVRVLEPYLTFMELSDLTLKNDLKQESPQ